MNKLFWRNRCHGFLWDNSGKNVSPPPQDDHLVTFDHPSPTRGISKALPLPRYPNINCSVPLSCKQYHLNTPTP